MLVRGFCLFMCFFLFSLNLQSQESIHQHFTTNDGLISNTIYDIRQDKLGYIWLATDVGLTRFDGNKFKDFPIEGNKSASISNILFVNGQTWVQNFNGQFFKTEGDTLQFQPQVSKLSNFVLSHDFDGTKLATLSEGKVLMYDPVSKKVSNIHIPKSVWISSINSTKNEFCLTNISSVIRINTKGKVIQEELKLPLKSVYYHYLIGDNEEFFVSKVEKKLFERKSGRVYDFTNFISNSFVQNAYLISNKQVAILTTNGVVLFDIQKKKFRRIFSEYSCSKLIEDREGNWWIGTLGDGLIFVPHQDAKIFLEGIEVSSLQRFGNTLFLGTKENKIYRYEVGSGRLKLIHQEIENHEVKSLFYHQMNNDFLYCSALFHYRIGSDIFKRKIVSVNQISLLDPEHYILCESNNLTIFPIKKSDKWLNWKSLQRTVTDERLTLFEGNRRFLNAVFYQNQIVAHASDGLWLVSQNKAKKRNVGNNADVIHISKSAKGIIITTGDQGIFLFANGKIRKLFRLSKSLQGERLYKTKHFDNTYYVLTYAGIVIANEEGKIVQQIMRSDGYPNVDIIDFEIISNKIYASSTTGFQIIPIPIQNHQTKWKPVILLNECLMNGDRIVFLDNLKLSPDENNLRFNFSIINYRALGKHQVFYSVNGKKWIPIEDNKLELNELAPGSYHVKLYAKTEDPSNRSEIKELNFEILAPFYLRWWFIGLIAIFIGILGFMLFRLRLNQIEHKNQILQEKLNLEKQLHESSLSAIKAQMNPHFLFNALNTIQSFIYTNEKEAASSYLVDFSELTRKILEMSNQTLVVLSEELEALRLYLKLEKMRFEEDFEFEIDIRELPHEMYQIPSMLIQPYVENAIKHGLLHKKGAKNVQLKFSVVDNVLFVRIIDNGIGMEASRKINALRNPKHQSFATDANQKRFELLNRLSEGKIGVKIQELRDQDNLLVGTMVQLSIPVTSE